MRFLSDISIRIDCYNTKSSKCKQEGFEIKIKEISLQQCFLKKINFAFNTTLKNLSVYVINSLHKNVKKIT